MWNVFNRTKELAVGFWPRCGQVCVAGRRRAALRERPQLRQLWLGVRI